MYAKKNTTTVDFVFFCYIAWSLSLTTRSRRFFYPEMVSQLSFLRKCAAFYPAPVDLGEVGGLEPP